MADSASLAIAILLWVWACGAKRAIAAAALGLVIGGALAMLSTA